MKEEFINNQNNVHSQSLLLRISSLFRNNETLSKGPSGWDKIKCHPEESLFRISFLLSHNRKEGGPEQQHLRTTRCAGFTLIELLVVVLIIGILSAIALPQYTKAVEKARVAQVLGLFKSVATAADVYYTATGELPDDFDKLDVALPAGWNGTSTSKCDASTNWCLTLELTNQSGWRLLILSRQSGVYEGGKFYYLWTTDGRELPLKQILCAEEHGLIAEGDFCKKLMGGEFLTDTGSHSVYSFL